MKLMFIDDAVATVIKAHSAQIAFAGVVAELALKFFLGDGMPWWLTATLFGAVVLARTIKQPSISGPKDTGGDDDAPLGV